MNCLLTRERPNSRGNEKCPTDSSFSHRNSFHSFRHVRFLSRASTKWLLYFNVFYETSTLLCFYTFLGDLFLYGV